MPQGVTKEYLDQLQTKYPNTEVIRLHAPFFYDQKELAYYGFHYTMRDFNFHAALGVYLSMFFGLASDNRAFSLAQRLNSDGRNVSVNVHANVLAGLVKDGRLDGVNERVPLIAENSLGFRSPYATSPDLISDPREVAKIAKSKGISRMLLGLDHCIDDGYSIGDILADPNIREMTEAIHLAGASHGLINSNDPDLRQLIQLIAHTHFKRPVRVAIDYDPRALLNLPLKEQYHYFLNLKQFILNQ